MKVYVKASRGNPKLDEFYYNLDMWGESMKISANPSYNKALDAIADMLNAMQDGTYFEQ